MAGQSEIGRHMLDDMEKLNSDDPRPPYLQLAKRLRDEIADGQLSPGDQLPSYQRLAEIYGVSLGTVKRAVSELRSEGVVVTRHGMGSYVRAHAAVKAGEDELAEMRQALTDITRRVEALERQTDRR